MLAFQCTAPAPPVTSTKPTMPPTARATRSAAGGEGQRRVREEETDKGSSNQWIWVAAAYGGASRCGKLSDGVQAAAARAPMLWVVDTGSS